MAKKEVKTDLWVARQLDDSKIKYDAQGSDVKEINDALQSASKRGTGNAGYPEYVAVVKDFVIVIEDKADLTKHQKLSNTGILSIDQKDIADYAVNGAYFYAKHIAQNSSFHKIFAIGVSGDEKHHKITPLYVDDRDGYKQLPDIESFTSFTAVNIDEYYCSLWRPLNRSIMRLTPPICSCFLIHLELSVIQLPRRLRKISGKNYSVNLMRYARKEPLMFLKLSTGLN